MSVFLLVLKLGVTSSLLPMPDLETCSYTKEQIYKEKVVGIEAYCIYKRARECGIKK